MLGKLWAECCGKVGALGVATSGGLEAVCVKLKSFDASRYAPDFGIVLGSLYDCVHCTSGA